MTSDSYWVEHCPKPRSRPAEIRWDVFISYRSADRIWALALHDMLRQAGYEVFLDQFALVAGSGLASQLSENLGRSASGVLVWSNRAADSAWVQDEYNAMVQRANDTRGSSFPFYFVPSKIDSGALPALLSGRLYIDFSAYPDGPTGSELVRLATGLQGKPLDGGAVARIAAFEEDLRAQPSELRAMVAAGQFDLIRERALAGGPAYTSSATLPALAAQLLISGKRHEDALAVLEVARRRFRRSVRLRQLRGLALRRAGRTSDAILELETLRADGHQDPETFGILAAAWAQKWEASGDVVELERSRNLYLDAFTSTPTDTYAGINAASKSAMLGELDRARDLAGRVRSRLDELAAGRGGAASSDYWERVTEPEALLLLGEFEKALAGFHAARVAHSTERGSIESTAMQVQRLARLGFVPEAWKARFLEEFQNYYLPQPSA